MCRYFGPVLACAVALLTAACGGGSSGGGPVVGPPMPPPVDTPPAIKTTAVFTQLSFSQPTTLRQAPGDTSRWFVAEKGGVIRVFANDLNATSSSVDSRANAEVSSRGPWATRAHRERTMAPRFWGSVMPSSATSSGRSAAASSSASA